MVVGTSGVVKIGFGIRILIWELLADGKMERCCNLRQLQYKGTCYYKVTK
jgi:hypothetical protein